MFNAARTSILQTKKTKSSIAQQYLVQTQSSVSISLLAYYSPFDLVDALIEAVGSKTHHIQRLVAG